MLINQRHYNPGLQGTQHPPHPSFLQSKSKIVEETFLLVQPLSPLLLTNQISCIQFFVSSFFYIYIKSCIYVSVCQQRQEALKPLQFLSYCVILVIYSSNQTLKQVIIIKDYIEQILHMKPYFLNKYLLLLITSIS